MFFFSAGGLPPTKEKRAKSTVIYGFSADSDSSCHLNVNELANISGVTPSTAYSMLDQSRRDVSIITIKKFCDGLEISLGEFFSAPEFDELEQEIL